MNLFKKNGREKQQGTNAMPTMPEGMLPPPMPDLDAYSDPNKGAVASNGAFAQSGGMIPNGAVATSFNAGVPGMNYMHTPQKMGFMAKTGQFIKKHKKPILIGLALLTVGGATYAVLKNKSKKSTTTRRRRTTKKKALNGVQKVELK